MTPTPQGASTPVATSSIVSTVVLRIKSEVAVALHRKLTRAKRKKTEAQAVQGQAAPWPKFWKKGSSTGSVNVP